MPTSIATASAPQRGAGYLILATFILFLHGCASGDAGDKQAEAPRAAAPADTASGPSRSRPEAGVVLVLGNSIAAGYGLLPEQSFPALLQQKIDSAGLAYEVVNAGLSGETTAGGVRRIDWLLRDSIDVLILELGGNDGLRGIDPAETRANLGRIITATRARYPAAQVLLAGMQIPPNMGQAYTQQFREVFPEVARTHDAVLIPFLLEGVGGVRTLNQADGIHPTATGQQIVAANVWAYLEPLLRPRLTGARP